MSENDLSEHIRDYYAGQEVEAETIRRWHENAELTRPVRFRRSRVLAVAAVAAVLLVLGVLSRQGWQLDATERIDREVLTNYAKHLEPEVRADNFEALTAGLSRLGFALAPTGEVSPLHGWQVEGGRYCSLAGELAAQVNLIDAQGRKSLLYVVALSEELAAAEPGERRYAGARVRLWKDANRVYVQAIP